MAPRISDLPLGAPLAQEKCRLFKLPAELRNVIYQLALSVKPDENGQVALAVRKPKSDTVLHLLGTCRIIYQEAAGMLSRKSRGLHDWFLEHQNRDNIALLDVHLAKTSILPGIFYHQHSIRIDVLQYNRHFQFRDFASPRRLQGLRQLTVAVECLMRQREVIVIICKRVQKLPALRNLTFVFTNAYGFSTLHKYWIDALEKEKHFLKRAIKQLVSVEELRFEVSSVLDAEDQEEFQKYVDEVVAVLPSKKRDESKVVKG